jgi:hypothetical protein
MLRELDSKYESAYRRYVKEKSDRPQQWGNDK